MNALAIAPRIHHVAVQTDDVESTVKWYEEFLGATVEWTLSAFSPLTRSRLPGIEKLVELKVGTVRFHVFDRAGHTRRGPDPRGYQFQHIGITVDSHDDLVELRKRWWRARERQDLTWARDEPPSDIVTDDDGMQSLYVLDPNGLEMEFIHFSGQAS
ncbi:VOC family protein [Streptomyces albus subsp. chlorinus]|uniref:VOC family protein n=1 Tax=Streptomyces albus TaxID=1888 RepID=UPI001570CDD9|nr:VOC family protein [Streptomyces albus]NSC25604.1 VOC family protein [Streptomyces albus subsp. chlorinus]